MIKPETLQSRAVDIEVLSSLVKDGQQVLAENDPANLALANLADSYNYRCAHAQAEKALRAQLAHMVKVLKLYIR